MACGGVEGSAVFLQVSTREAFSPSNLLSSAAGHVYESCHFTVLHTVCALFYFKPCCGSSVIVLWMCTCAQETFSTPACELNALNRQTLRYSAEWTNQPNKSFYNTPYFKLCFQETITHFKSSHAVLTMKIGQHLS